MSTNPSPSAFPVPPSTSTSGGAARLDFEMALQVADIGSKPLAEMVGQAADAAGCDLLFVLPSPDGAGITAMVHIPDCEGSCFLQVRTTEQGLLVVEETDISPDLLRFARASVNVLRRLRADQDVAGSLALRAH